MNGFQPSFSGALGTLMIFGYMEYHEMRIYKDLAEVIKEWGNYPIDVLGEVVIFYTESGKYLEPSPVYAKRKWYQIKPSIDHLTFKETVPSEANMDELCYLVHCETSKIFDNKFVNSVDSLKEKISYEI
ncbi:MAG: hypothetical protein ACRBHB_06700 [Arenicella sp.]